MDDREQPRERHWDEDHQIRIGSEWSIWRHHQLGALELPIDGMDGGAPEDALPHGGLPYSVEEPGRGFTSGRVTQVHVTEARG